MRLLIDGDIIVYRCAFAAEKTRYLNELHNPGSGHVEFKEFDTKKEATDYGKRVGGVNLLWSRKDVQPVENAIEIAKIAHYGIVEAFGVGGGLDTSTYITGTGNFRESVSVTRKYKGNRDEQIKPIHYQAIRDLLVQSFAAEVVEGFEADDVISHEAHAMRAANLPYCVVTTDKDLDQIPGDHYNWVARERYTITPKEAKSFFFTQWLVGDPVDNIPGIPGWGPARAGKALADCKTPDDMVKVCVEAYKQNFTTNPKDMAIEQARLVYIRRKLDEDWLDTKEGKLCLELMG